MEKSMKHALSIYREAITSLCLRFSLPDLAGEEKKAFDAHFAQQTVLSLKIVMPFTCLLHLFLLDLDANLYPNQFYISLTYRILVSVTCFCVFIATFVPRLAEELPRLVVPIWSLAAVAVAVTAAAIKGGLLLHIVSIVFTMLYVCGFVRTTFVTALICCVIDFPIVNSAFLLWNAEDANLYFINILMVYAAIIGLSLSYTIEFLERKSFILSRQLKQEKERSDNHSAWLHQLATFLRHEVRQPVAQINSSIELSALRRHDAAALEGHLTDATRATQHVWNLIERASRATDAEAYVREGHRERIDLQQLLSELVQSFTNTYSGVEFKFHGQIEVYVSADPDLIKEAISNLLSNAASFADEQTVIDVFLQRRGSMAEIRVCNKGPLIGGDTNTLFQPFATTRSGSSGEHHGLGLYLVRLIAQQHGGRAAIANAADGTGVEATIMIPVLN
jgi:signal transduction histidine kinase